MIENQPTMYFSQSEEIGELAKALAAAQGEMDKAKKDSKNPFFKSSYANEEAVIDASTPVLSKNGLSISQFPVGKNGLVSQLMHQSGQWIRGYFEMEPVKKDPQGVGSVLTYMRRYARRGICGIADTDDDGNAASQPPKSNQNKQQSNNNQQKQPSLRDIATTTLQKAVQSGFDTKIEWPNYDRPDQIILAMKSPDDAKHIIEVCNRFLNGG